jgi:calpain-15
LKNPHGSGGKEWIGDFSDQSELMTKRIMTLLNHTLADDGIFWMTLEDFIYEYKSLYICAVFKDGWTKIEPIT